MNIDVGTLKETFYYKRRMYRFGDAYLIKFFVGKPKLLKGKNNLMDRLSRSTPR